MYGQGVIKISGKPINPKQVIVSFTSLSGTNPYELGHFISIWEGRKVLSPSEALHTKVITASCEEGQLLFNDLDIGKKEYVIGYGLDGYDGMQTVCATLTLSAGARIGVILPANCSDVFVSPDDIGTDFLLAQLAIPFYYQEKYSFKWIALFNGEFNEHMYRGANVMVESICYIPQNCASILMTNIPGKLTRFETYTVVHGIGLDEDGRPDYSKLISYHTFTVWRPQIYMGKSDLIPSITYLNTDQTMLRL